MKKIINFILILSLILSCFAISVYADESTNVYSITTNINYKVDNDLPVKPTNNN